jgi:hypothetical protein
MDEKYDVPELVRVIRVERVTLVSKRAFDDVLAAIYTGLGRPDDFAALVQRWPQRTTPRRSTPRSPRPRAARASSSS